MKGWRFLLSAMGVLGLGLSSEARASDDDIFGADAEKIDDAGLAELRGGFVWEGVDIKFGAELRSYVNDDLVVRTNINWADSMPQVTTVLGPGVAAMSPAQLQAVLGANGLGTQVGLGGGYVTADGQTTFVHRIDGALQNVIVNTADNAAIRQQLDVTIDLGNFQAFQANVLASQLGSTMSSMIALAGIGR